MAPVGHVLRSRVVRFRAVIAVCRSFYGRFLVYLLTIMAAGVIVLPATATEKQAAPAMWRVEHAGNVVHLMGSMHFGRPDFYPLSPAIETAFAAAKILAVEVDISRLAPEQIMQNVMKYGRLPLEQSLETTLSPAVYRDLKLACQARGISISAFERFQPWFAALQLIEATLRGSDLQPGLGVDLYFLKRAGGKQLDELESFEGQLQLFAGLSAAEQEAFLEQTLRDIKNSEQQLQHMADAWRQGDLDGLYEEMIQPLRNAPEGAGLYSAMFTNRNIHMTDRVEQYLKGKEAAFVVVGAAHMLGEDGIVALLRKRGYNVDRVSPPGSP